eukprot:CAMPEP_0119381594 /NCGR_PEP_ID=MMETSP1334-20130426/65950_1 /TAXON_ID=127549 /ORGANISM="Calcidiscus leptoporus, Strain RCC1130" /LENGTH=57 /DNA_ID=CAMNT_0007401783 /DNA_START=38 /DNA_END=211 /DNA_ORIENTATION=+
MSAAHARAASMEGAIQRRAQNAGWGGEGVWPLHRGVARPCGLKSKRAATRQWLMGAL